HRQGSDAGRSQTPGGGDRQTSGGITMIGGKRAKREARRLFGLCLVDDLLDEDRTRTVTRHIASTHYRSCPAILTEFLRLIRLDRKAHTATIESAAPLPPDLRIAIQAGLSRRYGRGITSTYRQQPSLIGGVRIQVGSD